jgi:aerotaxis receptor
MKINQPVSQKEVPFPSDKYLVSKTDLRGSITQANDAFVEISGFTREELVGSSHNIVRHPDMPPQAFEDLWRTVKSGLPWRGLVKNRCKNGDHYWVEALVVPLKKNGSVTGYMSVRTPPSREQVRVAEALYAELRRSPDRKLANAAGFFGRLSLRTRLWAVVGVPLAITVATTFMNLGAGAGSDQDLLRNLSIAGTGLAVLIGALGGGLLVSSFIGPIRRAVDHFERIAEGNLTDEIDISRRDETGLLLCKLAIMQGTLKAMLDDIGTAANTIDRRCAQLEDQMRHVAEQSVQQQSSVESVAAASEQFSQSVQEVAANARETAHAAKESQSLLAASNDHIGESMTATNRVVDAVQSSSATIDQLNRSIQKIGEITKVIADIAGQTNLLALNAAIEAARAGEQGRGFAVVADEVRKLAERTSTSTADISSTVNEIQTVTQQAVSSMETAAREVETGIGKLRESVAGLEGITHSSRQVTGMAENISDAARQQGTASEEVAASMQRITDLIEHNTESAHEASRAVGELLATARRLDTLIKGFELHKRR